jgi:hypothetical protein
MAKQLRSEIDIDATAERVWQILTDFDAYPDWNPFLVRASGRPRQGERLNLHMQPVGGRGMTFRPTVIEASPGRRLRWLGRVLAPGIFDGEHSFTIEAVGEGKVRVIQEEQFRGILVPLLWRSLQRRTLPAFEQMNLALKLRAES